MLREGELGVHPPGALGVAFFVHARADCLIGRSGDGITHLLKRSGELHLLDDGQPRTASLRDRVFANLLDADGAGRMPELLLVCCNPDQLGLLTAELTRFLESLAERGRLRSIEDIRQHVPILLILPNGILAEQTLLTYGEQLNESRLMQRLPGVNDRTIEALLGRVVRGVSLQAGSRRGSGAETLYVLEQKGAVVFAGGGALERRRIEAVLTAHGYPFEHAEGVPGTRVEFDKAMISIVLNVGGLIHMVRPDGSLIDLRMGDLCQDPTKSEFVSKVTHAVFAVGQAIGAYPREVCYDDIWATHRATILKHAGHVTSSVKMFRDALGRGLNSVKLFPNEEWVLSPLSRYAANAGMTVEDATFRLLRREVQEAMARAIQHRDHAAEGDDPRARKMKLAAQRTFNVEMFDAGANDMVLVGTMLDNEHLIKLEVNVYMPDEQITRSRLDMIRVPFPVCREVESIAANLVGLRIERGALGEISRRVGGRSGCSHIKELATNIVYFAASQLIRHRTGADPMSTEFTSKPPEERFILTKELLRDSCLAYCQTTSAGLDEQIGIKRVGEDHTHALPLGDYEASLGVLLRERAHRFDDRVYLRYREGDNVVAVSWKDFADRVFRIAGHLLDEGIRRGDRIAVVSENRPEMFMFELAAMSVGAVAVPVFAGYHPEQISYVLRHARPRFVVVSGIHQLDKIERGRHLWVTKYYCFDFDGAAKAWGAVDFSTLLRDDGAGRERLDAAIDSVSGDDLCTVMYTSGTTGSPKGVRLCHRNLISQQKAMSLIWDVGEQDVFQSYLPWHHSFGGLFERIMTVYNGCELCLDDSRGRDIDRLTENWAIYRPTVFFSVPRVHDLLTSRCRERKDIAETVFDGRLRFVFTAGAALPARVEAAYREHDVPVLEGWGLTETSPCITATVKDAAWREGYVGLPLPGIAVRIDSDQEILVKGPNVMDGYLNDEEATAHVLDDTGWFRTGDLGEFTEHGLRLFGRKDGAFKLTTGEKVHPQRIENMLVNESPYIDTAVVLGRGENFVGALIYPDLARLREWADGQGLERGRLIDRPEVHELYAAEIGRVGAMIEVKYQRVRRAVLLDRELSLADGELTPSGKIVRQAVINRYQDKLDNLFAAHPTADVIEVRETQAERMYAHEA